MFRTLKMRMSLILCVFQIKKLYILYIFLIQVHIEQRLLVPVCVSGFRTYRSFNSDHWPIRQHRCQTEHGGYA